MDRTIHRWDVSKQATPHKIRRAVGGESRDATNTHLPHRLLLMFPDDHAVCELYQVRQDHTHVRPGASTSL